MNVRFSYGVPDGPSTVAFHCVISVAEVGKAEMPGVGEVMSVISSDWSLSTWLA